MIDFFVMDKVAQLLYDGEVVALFQGRSESGARALGNRSILFNPTIEGMNDYVNQIKGREKFRPLAATVLSERGSLFFDYWPIDESPYMLYAVNVNRSRVAGNQLPAVTHVDGTCRIQTVTEKQNPFYYKLIEKYYKLSDMPLVGNTSLNLAGEPLAETLDDALDVVNRSEIKYLYLPERRKLIIN